jgi:WD40 repeat protein
VALWDLDKKRLDSVITDAHEGTVCSAVFLLSQPLLLTTGADNSIKVWIFDQTGGEARLLRSRSGHHAPPSKVRYYGDGGRMLLTAGQDRALRSFNIVADGQATELSQGAILKRSKQLGVKADSLKLPTIGDFTANPARERDWDNIVTCHSREHGVRTWSYQDKRIGSHVLKHHSAEGDAKVTEISVGDVAASGPESILSAPRPNRTSFVAAPPCRAFGPPLLLRLVLPVSCVWSSPSLAFGPPLLLRLILVVRGCLVWLCRACRACLSCLSCLSCRSCKWFHLARLQLSVERGLDFARHL